MNKIIKNILYLIFGEWNGVQNFVAPTVMLSMFDQHSFLNWITGVLTFQRFFLPLFVYIVVLFSVIFLCLKVLVQWNQFKADCRVSVIRDLILPFIIKLHKWLLAFLAVIMLVFIVKSGFTFTYRQSFPLFTVYYWILRVGAVALTLYIFTFMEFAIPIVKRNRSLSWAQIYFHKFILKHWKSVVPVLIVRLLWIYVSVLLFTLAIDQFQDLNDLGFFTTTGKPLELFCKNVHNIKQFLYNTVLLLGVFLFSNLLYSPIMFLVNKGLHHFKLTLKSI